MFVCLAPLMPSDLSLFLRQVIQKTTSNSNWSQTGSDINNADIFYEHNVTGAWINPCRVRKTIRSVLGHALDIFWYRYTWASECTHKHTHKPKHSLPRIFLTYTNSLNVIKHTQCWQSIPHERPCILTSVSDNLSLEKPKISITIVWPSSACSPLAATHPVWPNAAFLWC